uniref:Uncharacterized protein n=1 Tax=Salix viminalis TaxID=40686 RepID=A0A6N2NEH4_SALVM
MRMRKHQWLRTTLSRAYYCSFSSSFPLKHVTQSNFESAVADLKTHLKAADFVAIDLEMTGVASAPGASPWSLTASMSSTLKLKTLLRNLLLFSLVFAPFVGTLFVSPSLLTRTISIYFRVKRFQLILPRVSSFARRRPWISWLNIILISIPAFAKECLIYLDGKKMKR